MFDPELDSFKTGIDLRSYATMQGYSIDQKESWRGSTVMRHANGDKIIVKADADGHYVYFSVRDDRDHGSILALPGRFANTSPLGWTAFLRAPLLGCVNEFAGAFGENGARRSPSASSESGLSRPKSGPYERVVLAKRRPILRCEGWKISSKRSSRCLWPWTRLG